MPDGIEPKKQDAKPAAKPGAAKILHARPIEGEIDHAALSHEFIRRFPKLRAALAK